MVEETTAERIKRLREARGLSIYRLAQLSELDAAYLSQLEAGKIENPRQDTLLSIAKGLGVPVGEVIGQQPTMEEALAQIKELFDAQESAVIQLQGYVSCGAPTPTNQERLGKIRIPRLFLGGLGVERVYGLVVSGDSLSGDNILSGYTILVDRQDTEPINGKIYIIRLPDTNEICARHIWKENGYFRLTSSDGTSQIINPSTIEIQGRVIAAGIWFKC